MNGDGERLPGAPAVGEAGGVAASGPASGIAGTTITIAAMRTGLVADPADALPVSGQPAYGSPTRAPIALRGDGGGAVRLEGPWRLLIVAFGWMLVVHLCVFLPIYFASLITGFMAGVTAAMQHVKAEYQVALSPYVSIGGMVFGQTVLLWGALERGTLMSQYRSVGGGQPTGGSEAGHRRAVLGNVAIRRWPALVFCIIACIAYQGLAIVWFSRTGVTHGSVPVGEDQMQQALIFLTLVVLAPLGEELTFRGWLWTGLRRHWSPLATTCATALLWSGAHVLSGLWNVAVLLVMGLLLGFARAQTQSVRATILLHMIFNLAALYLPQVIVWLGLV